jgi:putative membrane protein
MVMRLLGIVGKAAFLVFWLAVLANLLEPFAYPFHPLINGVAAALLLLHFIEMLATGARLKSRPSPWLDRLQVLLFGVFHWHRLPVAMKTLN